MSTMKLYAWRAMWVFGVIALGWFMVLAGSWDETKRTFREAWE